jgi:hypothetical protein
MPIDCAGGEVHYVALRPHDGLIEAVPEEPSAGERAIKRRYLVEHLVPVQASQPAEERPSIWTNCTAAEPCLELATVDAPPPPATVGVAIVEADSGSPDVFDHLLLRPGLYTVGSGSLYGFPARRFLARRDTFEVQAGHRYRMGHRDENCAGAPKHREARAEVCEGLTGWVETFWFEDATTNRVVAGDKWCSSDTDCPGSQCSAQAGQPRTCAIPALECTFGESCMPH